MRPGRRRVQLRDVPGDLYRRPENGGENVRNEIIVRVQPDPAIYLKITVKTPGAGPPQPPLPLRRSPLPAVHFPR